MADVVVVGAGVVGAACAYHAALAGLSVTVLERATVAGGTTGCGEASVLVSGHPPGPRLRLALLSSRVWSDLAGRLDGGFEYERGGGLAVAADDAGQAALAAFAQRQRAAGVRAHVVEAERLRDHEPHLAPGLAGGVHYPEDARVQPMLATAAMLREARRLGARLRTGTAVTGFDRRRDGRVTAVRAGGSTVPAGAVVNAAGTWGGQVAGLAGAGLPIEPRRGFVLVTEPLRRLVRHTVYAARHVSDVGSSDPALRSSPVIEGTRAGTVLIGASRERVGFDRGLPVPVLRRLAAQAITLFPFLAGVTALRTYAGFRPYCRDNLPVIGFDPAAPGLLHACGHEGAAVGLAAATGRVVGQLLTGTEPDVDLAPFHPERFAEAG